MSSKSSVLIRLKRNAMLRGAGSILDLGATNVELTQYPVTLRRGSLEFEVASDLRSTWEEVGESIKSSLSQVPSDLCLR